MLKDTEELFSKKFCFIHSDGRELYAVKMKNLDSGVLAFRVSLNGNKKSDGLEVDEDQMIQLVRYKNYSVRMTTLNRTVPASLFRMTGKSIKKVIWF
jgi:hypothetical protein